MPEVEEVFRLATNKVKPDPNALDRQQRRQRSVARSSRIRAYVAVAAVIVALAVGAYLVLGAVNNESISVDDGSGTLGQLTFITTLPAYVVEQSPAIVDLQGQQTSTVPGLPPDAFAPSLSSDGSTIAFVAAPSELQYNQIGIMDIGSPPRILSTPGVIVNKVALSPDGSTIAFEGVVGADTDIYTVGVDGAELRKLTNDPATDEFPQWSPDGMTIVYDNAGDHEEQDPQFSSTAEVWSVPADGSGRPTQLTRNGVPDSSPSFSPNGEQICYFHEGAIWIMASDGSDQQQLLPGSKGGFTPRWSPDGKHIAFTRFSDEYRPLTQLGQDYQNAPLVILSVVDVSTGRVTTLRKIGMATDWNIPQWVDVDHMFVMRIPVHSPS
jgi:Tol biopolymer transport system component